MSTSYPPQLTVNQTANVQTSQPSAAQPMSAYYLYLQPLPTSKLTSIFFSLQQALTHPPPRTLKISSLDHTKTKNLCTSEVESCAQEDSALLFLALFLATAASFKRVQGVLEQARRGAGEDLGSAVL
jgi:hypothetical protein